MSTAVYPTLPGLAYGVQRSALAPKVTVKTTPSEREYRARDATLPRYHYTLVYDFLRSSAALPELHQLVGFFNARGGSFESFLFRDPDDYAATAQAFGVGDGSTAAYPLVRSLGGFAEVVDAVDAGAVASINGVPAVNLIRSGGFEVDSNSDGLPDDLATDSGGSAGTVTYSRPAGNGSTYGLQIASSALASGASAGVRWQANSSPIGDATVTVGFDVYGFNCSAIVELRFYTVGGVFVSSTQTVVSMPASWARRSASFTVPSGAATCRLSIYIGIGTGAAAYANLDNVQVQPGNVATAYSSALATVDPATAVATFTTAPGAGAALTWSGTYYRRVRFAADRLDATKFMHQLWEAKRVELISLKAGST